MPALAMPPHKQHLVLDSMLLIQTLDFAVEALPLRQLGNGPRRVGRVCPVDKAKVDRRLCEFR